MGVIKNKHSYFYLLLGFIFFFFHNGRFILPIAAFLAPIFLIRFFRFQSPLKGFAYIIIAGWISNIFIWEAMMPVSGFFYYILAFMMSVFTSIIFLIDRVYSQRVKGIISTLVFPSAYVIMEYIVILTNPSGSYGTLAHTQSSLSLLQLISITGIWGVTFVIMWTASVINWLWDNSFERKEILLALLVYGIPFITIILYGQIRLSTETKSNTVRIASININESNLNKRFDALGEIYSKNNWNDFDSVSNRINEKFLNDCSQASLSGAKIIFGTEAIIYLTQKNEKEFIERSKLIAVQNNVYLGLPTLILLEGFPNKLSQNKIIWISPEGEELLIYHKSKPTPGEGSYGDGLLKYFDTDYGRVSTAICFDMDFPQFISQVSDMDIDLMLVPGNDWAEISPYHSYVSSFRAIEQGFNLVRAASKGLSASFNYKGQLINSLDYFKSDDLIFYSDVSTKGERTVYSKAGDYFAWLCILFFIIISGIVIKGNRTHSSS